MFNHIWNRIYGSIRHADYSGHSILGGDMDEIYVCDECGVMYPEPDNIEMEHRIERVSVCPYCLSENGHTYARRIDFGSISEDLDGIKYHDYIQAINKLERKDV